MRLKQLLGVALLLLASCALVWASTSQLTNVDVSSKGSITTVAFHASGAFTHNEYRPTDNLLLVDLAGVNPAQYSGAMKDLRVPGVASYHVISYKGAAGAEVTRVELALHPGAEVKIGELAGGVAVQITGSAPEPAKTAAAEPVKPAAEPAKTVKAETKPSEPPVQAASRAPAQASGKPVTVQRVAVTRRHDGLDIQITGSGVLTPKAMKLTSPDRVVVDLMNAVPQRRTAPIAVNSQDVKDVRVARYQVSPPVTRVVVDLAASRDYELVPAGNKLIVKLHGAATGATATPATPQQPVVLAQNAVPAAPAPVKTNSAMPVLTPVAAKIAPPTAQSFVVVEPKFEPKGDGHTEPAVVVPSSPTVAQPAASVQAAARFAVTEPPAFSTYTPPAPAQASQAVARPAVPAQQPAGRRQRYTGEPISVNLKDVDIKDFFRLIHEISGLNIVLDPNVRGNLTLVLDDVPWDQALDIVLQNNGLDKVLEGNVLRIATVNTLRQEAEAALARDKAQALAVPTNTYIHALSYAHAKEQLTTVKAFLSERGTVIADDRTNSLIIQDIPAVIPKIQQLLVQLDTKTPEVEIEARVVAANRNFARDIGTQLGFGWGNGSNTAVGGATAAGTSPVVVNGLVPKYFTLGSSIPLFSNLPASGATSGLQLSNATNNYRIDFILTAAESRGLVKILSRPRVVTQNNAQAVVRQGTQIPVVTGAQLGGPPTVTYYPAFLRLTVTPQITNEHTIYLNVDVENTTPDFGHQVGGNPSLLSQQALTQVLVSDGGTVMIGGVIQTQNSVAISQVPLLGSIPVLGNLFKHRAVSTQTQELIFFITPKIIQT